MEGSNFFYQPTKVSVIIGNHKLTASDITKPIIGVEERTLSKNILCFYMVQSPSNFEISKENIKEYKEMLMPSDELYSLGNYCACIIKPEEFKERVKSTVQKISLKEEIGAVKYFNPEEFNGEMTGFEKSNIYKHQNEFRILIDFYNKIPSYMVLDIGDLSDIAKVMTIDDFKSNFKIKLPDGTIA